MTKLFDVKIITPQEVFFEGSVSSLVIPGTEGSFGILCNHAPIIAGVADGIMKVTDENSNELYIEVGSGYLDMLNNSAVIITEKAGMVQSV